MGPIPRQSTHRHRRPTPGTFIDHQLRCRSLSARAIGRRHPVDAPVSPRPPGARRPRRRRRCGSHQHEHEARLDPEEPALPAGAGLERAARWRPGCDGWFEGQACVAIEPPKDATRFGMRSLPTEVSLDLLPWDVRPFFGHRSVERCDIFDIFERCHQLLITLWTHQHAGQASTALHKNGLSARSLHRSGKVISRVAHIHRGHTPDCTTRESDRTGRGRKPNPMRGIDAGQRSEGRCAVRIARPVEYPVRGCPPALDPRLVENQRTTATDRFWGPPAARLSTRSTRPAPPQLVGLARVSTRDQSWRHRRSR